MPPVHATYTIEIIPPQTANGSWNYNVTKETPPAPPVPVNGFTVKHDDTVRWYCSHGDWLVYFKNGTPVGTRQGPVSAIDGAAGAAPSGAMVGNWTKKDERYPWGVFVATTPGHYLRSPDPDIVIDSVPDRPPARKRKKPAQTGKGGGKVATRKKAAGKEKRRRGR